MFKPTIQDHLWFMNIALEEAEIAYKLGEVPVGALLVDANGAIISKHHNFKETQFNPTAHAEVLTLIDSAKKLGNWRLSGSYLYVTLEPCPMCLSAMAQARIAHCIYGAYDAKGGALSLGYRMHQDKRLNHAFKMTGGIKHYECSKLLSQFFKERRRNYPKL